MKNKSTLLKIENTKIVYILVTTIEKKIQAKTFYFFKYEESLIKISEWSFWFIDFIIFYSKMQKQNVKKIFAWVVVGIHFFRHESICFVYVAGQQSCR